MRPDMRSPPPYTVRPSETDPLIPCHVSSLQRHSGSLYRQILTVFLTAVATAVVFAAVFPLRSCNDPLDPDVRDRIHRQWELERRHHQEEVLKRIDIEHRWRVEDDERAHIREQWIQEAEEHNREVRERREREERERLEMNMMWIDPVPHTCTSYGTREYTALLANVPKGYDFRVEACMATPIEIHGIEYKANWCEESGPNNVIGHWNVDQYEPDCASYWNWYKDLGCVSPGSGQRRIEHYLENLPQGADWREFCATTPVSFRGMHFTGAQFSFQKDFGTYGHWVFDDESCK